MPAWLFFYSSLVVNVFLILVLVWLVTRYQELLEGYHSLKLLKERSKKVADKWLEEARKKSEGIIEEAEQKASKTMVEAESFNEQMRQKLDQSLQGVVDQIGEKVGREMAQEVASVATQLSSQAMADFGKARESVEEYRNSELAKIDNRVNQIVDSVSREVLGEIFSRSDQEELVRKALDKVFLEHGKQAE